MKRARRQTACLFQRKLRSVLETNSPEETRAAGVQLTSHLSIPGTVLLRGSLGMGKTTLARGIAEGLGVEDPTVVCSPSYTLVNIYQGKCRIYHVDLFRLEGGRDFYSIGLEEFLGKDGVTIVEWSERLSYAVHDALVVELKDAGGNSRLLRIFEGIVGKQDVGGRPIRQSRGPDS